MKSLNRIFVALLDLLPIVSGVVGWYTGPAALRPPRRILDASDVRAADSEFSREGARREDFTVSASDAAALRGWKVRAAQPNGAWVLLFHGQADNRIGVLGQATVLLRA